MQGAGVVNVLVLYFSGTGNTHYVARIVAERIGRLVKDVDLFSIEQLPPQRLAEYDVVVAGFPVYGLDSPQLFQEYLMEVPAVQHVGVFFFCTKGGIAGGALRRNLERLASKGYVPLGGVAVPMPGTDGLMVLRKDSWFVRRAVAKDYGHLPAVERLLQQVGKVIEGVESGETLECFRRRLPIRLSGLAPKRLTDPLIGALVRSGIRALRADERCVRCGLCAALCPLHNIVVDDLGVHFGENCELCLRCLHQCPQEAIQVGRLTVNKARWRGPDGRFDAREVAGPGWRDRDGAGTEFRGEG